ncbi:MAG: FAD-dependent oxidoreductase, partial [Candidatus Eremiobacterota bacterium]
MLALEPNPPWTPPARATRGPLREKIRCDVVVIGAGPTGLAAALSLAERKVDVVLLEAGHVGHEAEGIGAGLAL